MFDVETLKHYAGAFPIMATAIGKKGWYAWLSPWLTEDDTNPAQLIPLGPPPSNTGSGTLMEDLSTSSPQLLIGHHVLFDRARCSTEYSLARPATRWLDTLSLHVAVSGITSPQRPTWLKYRKDLDIAAVASIEESSLGGRDEGGLVPPSTKSSTAKKDPPPKTWTQVSSVNSLAEVARLHCGIDIDKSKRDLLIDPSTTPDYIRSNFREFLEYCATDVSTTHSVFLSLLPQFLDRCPHAASFGGVLLMSQPILPVDQNWTSYLDRAEGTYQMRSEGVNEALVTLAEEARRLMDVKSEDGRMVWEKDIWLRQLDWSPKRARRLKGAIPDERRVLEEVDEVKKQTRITPEWATRFDLDETGTMKLDYKRREETLLLKPRWRGYPAVHSKEFGWLFVVGANEGKRKQEKFVAQEKEEEVVLNEAKDLPLINAAVTVWGQAKAKPVKFYTIPCPGKGRTRLLLGKPNLRKVKDGILGGGVDGDVLENAFFGDGAKMNAELKTAVEKALKSGIKGAKSDVWLAQLDWESVEEIIETKVDKPKGKKPRIALTPEDPGDLVWPKWYWDLDTPGVGLEVTIRKRATPLLLKLQWRGFPILHSKLHGWVYRVPSRDQFLALQASDANLVAASLCPIQDAQLVEDSAIDGSIFIRLPHPDGEDHNVGSPLSKPFVSAFEDGILTSTYRTASDALALNASCSYWASARERIMGQMVVWEGDAKHLAPKPKSAELEEMANGMILPQVIPMGTVTRRAVEKTWLTASNAKKNRVGSELKSNVRAPKGYAIVGADVDSEELWICSVMGDAQFGIHGATAIGWMTLEGTKNAGTDLHSKSAAILGISRDQAKVFNYSRIYGAGVKHAVQLLLKSNPTLAKEQAQALAKNLYKSTKGAKYRVPSFGREFWHGGTESFVFNKLEGIALSDHPKTPAFGCGLTSALTRKYLPASGKSKAGEDYLPSRINWVVQSSGVDYLHALLVAMEYLTTTYQIDARYMISVHDEVRYLVKEEDKYRAAMALQIANVWTRTLFAYRLQMADLPQVRFPFLFDCSHSLTNPRNFFSLAHSSQLSISITVSGKKST